MEQLFKISEFILKSFIHIWPYLLVTIPLAVLINLSGASKHITRAFSRNPLLSVLIATIAGAFSPFCSCGVIPVISSLLIGGVPLAPVMSFWIASPSMDPEIFFLSSSVIGWKLAVWRLASTFVISLSAGYITHFAALQGFLSRDVLKTTEQNKNQLIHKTFIDSIRFVFTRNQRVSKLAKIYHPAPCNFCCLTCIGSAVEITEYQLDTKVKPCNCSDSIEVGQISKWKRVSGEIVKATLLVTKFMGLAFLITALITFYLPENVISGIVSANPTFQVIFATVIGIPVYTSNITALPLVGGLLDVGMNKGAALSFLIGGATTTLPAMVAVWGITKRRVFVLYLSFALFGALLAGLCFNLFN